MSVRNPRKHFVKCVDCSCQTLPRNASGERPWASAASLYVSGRINDGALCFTCANKRRERLGLPLETVPESDTSKGEPDRAELPTSTAPAPKKIRINKHEYAWDVGTLDALIERWKEQQFYDKCKTLDNSWPLVVVNNKSIPAGEFSSVPISEGDEILIVLGRGRVLVG